MASGLGLAALALLFGGYPLIPGDGAAIREIGIDRLAPIHDDRQLDSTAAHVFLFEKRHEPWRLNLRIGATLTRVTGEITQLEGSWEAGNLHSVVLDSPAWGLGPTAEARFILAQWRGVQASVDVTGALLFYDRPFPAGGERYNGMLQAGPTVGFDLGNGHALRLSYRWMHVSNGQGTGAHNPSYEAQGLSLRWQWRF